MLEMIDEREVDFSLLCRICAKSSDRLIPIFKDEGLSVELADKMREYLSLKVDEDEDLPKNVCLQCATAVVSWHDLVVLSHEANRKLYSIFQSRNIDDPSIVNDDTVMEDSTDVNSTSPTEEQNSKNLSTNQVKENEFAAKINSFVTASESANKTPNHGERANTMTNHSESDGNNLQAYKLHYPWKYHKVNGTFFLRTKVLGFEPAEKAYTYACCLCRKEISDSEVIAHSKSHYPLTDNDSCLLCHFSFATISLLRNHIKRHMIIIDEEYMGDISEAAIKGKNLDMTPETRPKEKRQPKTYVCEYCGLVYKRRMLYLKHVQNYHLNPLRCKKCSKKFSSKALLGSHKCQIKSKESVDESLTIEQLTCKCSKLFETSQQLQEHMQTCDQDILCEECGLIFQTRKEYRKHNLQKHSRIPVRKEGANSWICEICGCKLGKHSARKHYLTHSFKEKKYTCEICNMKFRQKWSLANHIQSHSNNRPFVCEICSKTFKRSDHLREHQLNKHRIGKTRTSDFKCDICRRFFTSETYLIRHKRLHSTRMSYECPVCKGRFPTEHSLKMHQTRMKHDALNQDSASLLSSAASDRINKFRCKVCFQRYGSMASLKKHKLRHCPGNVKKEPAEENEAGGEGGNEEANTNEESRELEKTYECPKCNLRYLTAFGLKLHFARSKHSEVTLKYKRRPKKDPNEVKNPRFKCVQCNEIFSSLVSLRMHKIKRKHFSKCPHCGKRFAMEFKLKVHLVKVHQQKDVIVEESDLLTQEEKLPHQCPVCSQLFAMKHNLESHVLKKHSTKEEENSQVDRAAPETLAQPKTEPIDVFEEFSQEISVIYHCTDCWENFASEEDFNNHSHEARIILTEDLPENAIISEVIET